MNLSKIILKFLLLWMNKLMMIYLRKILLFQQLMNKRVSIMKCKRFMWSKKKESWKTRQLMRAIIRKNEIKMRMKIITANYCYIAIAINWKHVWKLIKKLKKKKKKNVYNIQATHSMKITNAVYKIREDLLQLLNAWSISIFRKITDKWYKYLKLIFRKKVMKSQKRSKSELILKSKRWGITLSLN